MKKLIHRVLASRGLELRRKGFRNEVYRVALETLLSCRDRIRIAQIGANDGHTDDPLHNFMKKAADRSDILLVEPQSFLLPILQDNYSFHPNATIFEGAIGPSGQLTLYGVDRKYWSELKPIQYAKGWPEHRALTGVTSVNREHVVRFLTRFLKDPRRVNDAIMAFDVESLALPDVIARTDFGRQLDVLQVDAEGFDDQVIYHSGIHILKPKIIHFEYSHLTPDRLEALASFLDSHGYTSHNAKYDTLSILTHPGT